VIKPNNYPTKRFIDVCNILPTSSYNFVLSSCSYKGVQPIINDDNSLSAFVKEGDSLEFNFSFERPVQFMQPSSDNKNLGNVEYSITSNKDSGYSIFVANTGNIMFKISKKSLDGFDVYTRVPSIIKVLPFDGSTVKDGVTYFKTTTPNGEIEGNVTLDRAINNITIYKFGGEKIRTTFFGSTRGDVMMSDDLIWDQELRDNYDREIEGRFFYNEKDEEYITSDSNDFGNITFIKGISLEDIKVFAILVDRVYVSNTDNMLINKLRTIETSELVDTRNVLLKFDPSNSFVELRKLNTSVTGTAQVPTIEPGEEEGTYETGTTSTTVDSSGTTDSFSQTVAFKMKVILTGDPSTALTNQIFADYGNIGLTFMFRKGEDEYFIDCGDVKFENEDTYETLGYMELLLKMKWTQEMGLLNDGSWRCYMLAKTSSGFAYKVGEFGISVTSQTMPTTDGGRETTNGNITN
jgi:hypothetical protein